MREIPSCDTLAVHKSMTASGGNLFAKNSDRDIDEAQPLVWIPAQKHPRGEKLRCTYIQIDQAGETYGMIGSKPWWIWGFEHGVNEYGVAIGNEADWSEIPPGKEEALLGMDLLRLGLERGKTAYQAMHVIIELLEEYGQGGSCSYGGPVDDSYHNTFMISDPEEIWLLETVDRHWIAKKITGAHFISNTYSIEEGYDEASVGLIEYALENGLHDSRRPFNFAKSFMLLNSRFLTGHLRGSRLARLKSSMTEKYEPRHLWTILRDHYEGESIHPRWSPASASCASICMHGSEPGPAHTAASMVVEYRNSIHRELLFTCWTSMCPPCSGFPIPIFNIGYVPQGMGTGTNRYSPDSFWWRVKRMQMGVECDYNKYILFVQDARNKLEPAFKAAADSALAEAENLFSAGKADAAKALLRSVTDDCFAKANRTVLELTELIENDIDTLGPEIYRAGFIKNFKEKVGMI
jgi:secernin